MSKIKDEYNGVLTSYLHIFDDPKYTPEEKAKYTSKILEWYRIHENSKK